jgi:hypothetical protein
MAPGLFRGKSEIEIFLAMENIRDGFRFTDPGLLDNPVYLRTDIHVQGPRMGALVYEGCICLNTEVFIFNFRNMFIDNREVNYLIKLKKGTEFVCRTIIFQHP